jgi:hypothetical protein
MEDPTLFANTWRMPSTSATYARVLPSGDQAGEP